MNEPAKKKEPTAEELRKPLNLYQRLNKVREGCGYLQREKKAGMQYSIVSHDAVIDLVRDEMIRWGVLTVIPSMEMTQSGNRTEVKCLVRFINVDQPADQLDVVSAGYGIDQQDKGPGKAFSYAYKYGLMKTLSLYAGDEDPDQHQQAKLKGEGDPMYQNIMDFLEAVKKADDKQKLLDVSKKFSSYLKDATKKYGREVNEARATYVAKLATYKEKEAE